MKNKKYKFQKTKRRKKFRISQRGGNQIQTTNKKRNTPLSITNQYLTY